MDFLADISQLNRNVCFGVPRSDTSSYSDQLENQIKDQMKSWQEECLKIEDDLNTEGNLMIWKEHWKTQNWQKP